MILDLLESFRSIQDYSAKAKSKKMTTLESSTFSREKSSGLLDVTTMDPVEKFRSDLDEIFKYVKIDWPGLWTAEVFDLECMTQFLMMIILDEKQATGEMKKTDKK